MSAANPWDGAIGMRARILSCFVFFTLPCLASAQGSDWPKFLGPLGTSVSTEKGILTPWPKDGPKILWHKELGPGYGMPTIAKGKLYHFDRKAKRINDKIDERLFDLSVFGIAIVAVDK